MTFLRVLTPATGDGSRTRAFYRYRDGAVSERDCRGTRVRWSVKKDVVTLCSRSAAFSKVGRKVAMAVGSTRHLPDGVTLDDGPVSALKAPAH